MWDFILRLFVAGILGAVVGLDREYRAKEAGYRTHFLVSLGSALIMVVSQYGFQDVILENSVSLDPNRVAAQVVSGIGFIGAGTIIIQKQFVRGLTTAAGIWATAGIGLAVGSGMYGLGIAATLLTLAGLELLSVIFKSIGMRSSLVVFSTSDKEAINRIADLAVERKTGARGLRSIMESVMMDLMYEIPSDSSVGICTITKDVVDKTGKPEIVYRDTAVPRKTIGQRLKKDRAGEIA